MNDTSKIQPIEPTPETPESSDNKEINEISDGESISPENRNEIEEIPETQQDISSEDFKTYLNKRINDAEVIFRETFGHLKEYVEKIRNKAGVENEEQIYNETVGPIDEKIISTREGYMEYIRGILRSQENIDITELGSKEKPWEPMGGDKYKDGPK
jgi:hypothetical protein